MPTTDPTPAVPPDRPQHCYGCQHLTRRLYADGSMFYGCELAPGLVRGESSPFSYDTDPVSCEMYTT